MGDAHPHRRIVCSSHAFLGGRLNLAHAAAIYLPASVEAGLGRLFGRPSLFATGIDLHGRKGERILAGRSKADADVLRETLIAEFLTDLAKLGIKFDIFVRTDSAAVVCAVEEVIARLRACGRLHTLSSATLRCTGQCGDLSVSETQSGSSGQKAVWKAHPSATDARDLRCALCGAPVKTSAAQQYAIDLTGSNEVLSQVPASCSGKIGRKLLSGSLSEDFNTWTISRSGYNGLPFPGDPDRSLYVWFPAIVSKAILADHSDLSRTDFFEGKHATFYFGKNIVHYYAKVMPLILHHCFGVKRAGFSYRIRGFCDLARSAQMLDCDVAVARHGLAALRFYCLYTVDDDARDFYLLPERVEAVKKGVMQGIFAQFLKMVELEREVPAASLDPRNLPPTAAALWARLDQLHQQGSVRAILLALETAIQGSRADTSALERLALYQIVRDVLEIYVPGWCGSAKQALDQPL